MKNLKKGFTLIELLVVIAIIGILSSIVLASLSSARTKGEDAAIQSTLSNVRAQAELYYSNNNNYGAAVTGGTAGCDTGIFNDATTGGLKTLIDSAQTRTTVTCAVVGSSSYSVSALLKSPSGTLTHYCVDAAGSAKATTSASTNGFCG